MRVPEATEETQAPPSSCHLLQVRRAPAARRSERDPAGAHRVQVMQLDSIDDELQLDYVDGLCKFHPPQEVRPCP